MNKGFLILLILASLNVVAADNSSVSPANDSIICEDIGFGPHIEKKVVGSNTVQIRLTDEDYGVLALTVTSNSDRDGKSVKYFTFADGLVAKSLPEIFSYIGNSPVKNLKRTQEIVFNIDGVSALSLQAFDGCGFISDRIETK